MKQKLLLLFLPLLFAYGLRAQTHFPLYNPNAHYSNDTDATERLLLSFNVALNRAKKQVNASDKDFNAFILYNQVYMDSERSAVYPQIKAGKFTSAKSQNYINTKAQKLVAMYNSFSNQYKNIQLPKLAPSYTLPTCDSACTNMDFSTGDFTGWYGYYEVNNSPTTNFNLTNQTGGYLGAVTKACYDPNTTSYQMHITHFGQFDWLLRTYSKILMSQVSPWGTGNSVMLGDSVGTNYGVARLEQEFEVTPITNSITYAYSIFVENPNPPHQYYQQPFFSVTLLDSSGDTITNCGKYFVSAGPGLPGFKGVWTGADTAYWRDWTQVNVSLTKYIGQCVTIVFQVSDCALGGHFGYAYVDASCEPFVIKPATPGGLMCHPGTLTLDGPFGGSSYRWSGPKGGIVGADTNYDAIVDSLGTYTLILTPAQGELCTDTLTYKVTKYDSLKATAAVTNPIRCYGGVGTALATAVNGITPYTYLWTAPGGTNATGTGLSAGTYYVVVSDSNTCSVTASVVLTQPPTPLLANVKITPVSCGNGNRTATVTASGGSSPYAYLWAPGGKTTATITGPGSYTVTVTDGGGCTVTAAANIIQPGPVIASISNISNVTCNGGVGSATVAVSGGSSPYTYNWNPSGQTTVTATGLLAGSYTVTVKDTNGCTASAKAVITQPAAVTGSISAVYPACNGGTGSLTLTASGGTPAYKYAWTPGGQTTAAVTGLTAGSYSVKITDSKGCTGSVSVTMTQPATLAVTTSFNHASCGLANGTATAIPTGGTSPYAYSWSPGGQTNITATGLLAGTYTVKVTDSHSCTASATVTVTQPSPVLATITGVQNAVCYNGTGTATVAASGGTAPYGYLWSPGGGNGATGTGLAAGNYTVTVKDANGCTVTAKTAITQPAAIVVTISGPQIRCLGDSGTFRANVTGGTSPYIYSWTGGSGIGSPAGSVTTLLPPGSIIYTLKVTDANGCTQNQYISFNFPPPLAVSINGASVTCSKRTANLCALATGGTGGDTYLWEPINLSSPCVTIPASVTTVYTVTVTDNCGVSAKASAKVDVQPPPAVSFISNSTQGCSPLCVQFRNTTPPTGGTEMFIWNFGNGDSLREENPIYCYTKSGVFNVTLTVVSDSGCSSSLRQVGMISVYSRPKAAFTYAPQPVTILTPTVEFTDETSDGYGIGYRWWNFGDNSDSISHAADPVHTYQDTGTYCATLIAMNDKGCSDTITNCLIIEPQYSLYIPSAFTPNGDGLNEVFKPVGEYISDFDMYIFDRWGMEIYHTTDITKGWNGAIHGVGSICQEDIYIYKITVTDAEHNQHSYMGNVTLLK